MKQKKRIIFSCFLIILFILCIFFYTHPQPPKIELVHPTPTYIPNNEVVQTYVLYVIDGDSLAVAIHGKKEEVRLLGIDTPELYGDDGKPECFSREAKEVLQRLVINKTVTLTPDPTQDNTDTYGRLLRYVMLPDGIDVNAYLLQHGYAREYTYRIPYQHQQSFQILEQEAQNAKKGMWSETGCLTN